MTLYDGPPLTVDHRAAHVALATALLQLAREGDGTPCQGPQADAWTADDLDLLEYAAAHCRGCPVFDACAAVAPHEQWGVWAGQIRTRKPLTKKEPAA